MPFPRKNHAPVLRSLPCPGRRGRALEKPLRPPSVSVTILGVYAGNRKGIDLFSPSTPEQSCIHPISFAAFPFSAFQQFVRFVDEFKPKYFVLENVPTIVTTANGFFKDQIVEAFNRLGYDVTYGVLCAADYGVPQDRHRAVFLGQLGKLQVSLPKPSDKRTTIKEAIYDLPFIASGEGNEEMDYDKPATSDYQKIMRMNSKTLFNHSATKHNALALRRLAMIPKGAGKEVLPPEERTKSIYSGTWSRMIEDDISVTITTRYDTPSSGRFTHPILDRCITTREAARIQSFPDTFRFYGTKTCQMKQVGNAVPPLLAKSIALEILNNEKK